MITQHYLSFLVKTLGIVDFQCCKDYDLLSKLSSIFQSSTTIFHYRKVRMQNIPNFDSKIDMDFIQVLIIHDGTCKPILQKCN
jgi:hypothetical protein